nr:T9SS type A sorting domain-containing protein [Lacinutrix mariniflava]
MDASIWDGPNSFTTISINNDLAIVDTNVGQDQYTSIPLTQISSIANGITIENVGTVEATNVILTVAVADSNSSEVYTESSSPQVIAVGASLPITFTGFTPTMLGSYTVTYTLTLAETDTDLSNNTTSSTKEISLGTYARDNNIATGSLGIGTGNGGQLGQQFDILVTQDIVSVTFEIANQSNDLDGTTTFVTIWDMASDVPNAIIAQTEVVTITGVNQSYTANIIGNAFSLDPGKYLIAIEEGTSNISLATTENIFTVGTTWVNWPGNPNGTWSNNEDFGFNVSYLLRPNLQDPTLSIKDNEISNNLISIFPNPANSTINVSGLTTKQNYTIYNILGAKISIGEISNINNSINVNDFANGIYLLKFNNGNTLKFVKE